MSQSALLDVDNSASLQIAIIVIIQQPQRITAKVAPLSSVALALVAYADSVYTRARMLLSLPGAVIRPLQGERRDQVFRPARRSASSVVLVLH